MKDEGCKMMAKGLVQQTAKMLLMQSTGHMPPQTIQFENKQLYWKKNKPKPAELFPEEDEI